MRKYLGQSGYFSRQRSPWRRFLDAIELLVERLAAAAAEESLVSVLNDERVCVIKREEILQRPVRRDNIEAIPIGNLFADQF